MKFGSESGSVSKPMRCIQIRLQLKHLIPKPMQASYPSYRSLHIQTGLLRVLSAFLRFHVPFQTRLLRLWMCDSFSFSCLFCLFLGEFGGFIVVPIKLMGFQNSKYCRVSAAPDDNVKELKDAGILGFCPNAPKRPSHPAHMVKISSFWKSCLLSE